MIKLIHFRLLYRKTRQNVSLRWVTAAFGDGAESGVLGDFQRFAGCYPCPGGRPIFRAWLPNRRAVRWSESPNLAMTIRHSAGQGHTVKLSQIAGPCGGFGETFRDAAGHGCALARAVHAVAEGQQEGLRF